MPIWWFIFIKSTCISNFQYRFTIVATVACCKIYIYLNLVSIINSFVTCVMFLRLYFLNAIQWKVNKCICFNLVFFFFVIHFSMLHNIKTIHEIAKIFCFIIHLFTINMTSIQSNYYKVLNYKHIQN